MGTRILTVEDDERIRTAVKLALHNAIEELRAAMSDLAVLLMNQGKNDEAKKLLEQVIAINPQDKTAAANLEQLRKGSR